MLKISLIVPVYNVEKYLNRCIESILVQTFHDFELILVDDESPDNCGVICDEYAEKDERVKVIHKKNGGVSSARNAGLDVASGKYVVFCDSDDFLCEDWLATLYLLITKKNVDSVVTNFSAVNDYGKVLNKSMHKQCNRIFENIENKMDYIMFDILGGKTGWEVWTRIFKLSLINKYKIRFCENCENYAEDLSFVLQYTFVSGSTYVSEYNGYRYYQRENSMMHRSEGQIRLNPLNEVSQYVFEFIKSIFEDSYLQKIYPIIHYLIMYTEYRKLFIYKGFDSLPQEIKKINNVKWYIRLSKKISFCYPDLLKFFGKENASRIFILSRYCVHRNYKRFKLESGINYKFFIR